MSLPTAERYRRVARVVAPAAALLLILVALAPNLAALQGLRWPPEMDHHRDMGAAQSLLDGNRGADPLTSGELWWYPPLVPTLWAAVSAVSGQPPPWVVTHLGVWMTALAAFTFYVFCSMALGRSRALLCLAAFLFLGSTSLPPWTQAGLSPWPWPALIVQGLAYLSFALWLRACSSGRLALMLATGLMLGFTFLGHAAPALILALAVLIERLWYTLDPACNAQDRRRALLTVVSMSLIALVVVSPFLLPLLFRYGLRNLNDVPGRLVGLEGTAAARALVGARPLLAAVGLWAVWRRPSPCLPAHVRRCLLALVLSVGALMTYGQAVQTLERAGWVLPLLVPAFHFHLYLTALQSVFFGFGVLHLSVHLNQWMVGWRRGLSATQIAALLTALLAVAHLPGLVRRADLVHWRTQALTLGERTAYVQLYAWARMNASAEDVFLANDEFAVYPLSAAGRRVVATIPSMTSPFVDSARRRRDRDLLCAALRSGDSAAWGPLAAAYRVRWVVLSAEPPCQGPAPRLGLAPVAAFSGLTILEVTDRKRTTAARPTIQQPR